MLIREVVVTSDVIEEGWRERAGAAAIAAGIGLGGLGYKHYSEQPPTNQQPKVQQVKKLSPSTVDMRSMTKEDIVKYIKRYSMRESISWKPNEFNQFLAQVFHETSNLQKTAENLYYTTPRVVYKTFTGTFKRNPGAIKNYLRNPEALANLAYANRMGNGDEASGDGWRYRGRGLLHITGKDNYAKVGKGIGVDLISNPDLLLTNPEISVRAAIWYWKNITAAKLAKSNLDFSNTLAVTKTINPAKAGLKNRQAQFSKLKNQSNNTGNSSK
jgi:putative chitinase